MIRFFGHKYGSLFAHILMWCLLGTTLLLWQPLTWRIDIPQEFWYKQALLFVFLLCLFYTNSEVLIPKLLQQNKFTLFLLVNIGLALAVAFLIKQTEIQLNLRELMNKAFRAAREGGIMKRLDYIDHFSLLIALIIIGVSTVMASIRSWQNSLRAREELEKEKLESELSFLKAQINPHFFFNTLNNIYALTQIDNEKAGAAVHKLSRMMRYVLYDTLQNNVMMSQEIEFLQDYVELMKLRLTEKVDLSLNINANRSEVPIAPMLFLPFVENAFKHGTSTTEPSVVRIEVTQSPGEIRLLVKNTLFQTKKSSLDASNGIGLSNTRRRLDILYPDQYELKVDENTKEKCFLVDLKLKIP
jgi:two-component system LytT family sensor kinase